MIDWYHQRCDSHQLGISCVSQKTSLLQSSGPFRAVNEPSSHEQNSSSGFGGKRHQHDTRLCLWCLRSGGLFLSWFTSKKLWKGQTAIWLCLGSMDFSKSWGHTKDIIAFNYRSWSTLLQAGSYEYILVYSSWSQVCYYVTTQASVWVWHLNTGVHGNLYEYFGQGICGHISIVFIHT